MSKASNGFMERPPWGFPDTLARSHRREEPPRVSRLGGAGFPAAHGRLAREAQRDRR